MRQLIPRTILDHAANERTSGNLQARTMFIDVSGFTLMTHTLMKNGKEGAEILTGIINRVFTPAIDSIYRNHGFVSCFAGDAFTAVFPAEHTDNNMPLRAAMDILTSFESIGFQTTRFGDFQLAVKIGVSRGEVEWKIIRCDEQNAYYFRGDAIDGAARCEKHCEKGCAVIDFEPGISCRKEYRDGYYHVQPENWMISSRPVDIKPCDTGIERFIPEAVINLKTPGEFRDVISMFISFDEGGNLDAALPEIVRLAVRYGGYFNKFDFGDKGGIALVIFGAPVGREKMFARACDYALALRQLPDINLRVGMTFGTAFTGFVGSDTRSEYTALGMVVNLSARFAMSADWHQIYVDRFFNANLAQQYKIEFKSDQVFKGFPEPIPVYLLEQRLKSSQQNKFSGKLIDRADELQKLTETLSPLNEKRFGGLIYLDGSAGTGKSRLIHEMMAESDEIRWIEMPCDGILRKSFNPILHFLELSFEQEESRTLDENRATFDQRFDEFQKQVLDADLRVELERTRSVIGGMLGLRWENSLYEQLDARGRYENTLYALKTLILAMSLHKPRVIVIDDAHLIDTDTVSWLTTLTRNVEDYPFAIVLSCRFQDDGSSFDLVLKDVPTIRLRLQNLSREAAQEMIAELLGSLPEATFNLVWNKSEGNPFYIEQILMYLQENNLLANDFTLKNDKIEIPSRINEIIIARIDRLTEQVKQAVQTASVLGREFPVNILSTMLHNITEPIDRDSFDEIVVEAQRENIWMPLQKLRYIFNNTLIREVVYGIQLKQRLRELHRLAADTIRELFDTDIELHYSDLAYHYDNAEIRDRAIEYLEKASSHAKRNYQNRAALQYRSRQIELLKQELDTADSRAEIVQSLVGALLEAKYYNQVLGNMDEANKAVEEAAEIAHKWGSRLDIAKTNLDLANLLKLSGNYEQCETLLKEALELFSSENDLKMLGLTYLEMGVLSFWQGKQKDAFHYFEEELNAFEKMGDPLRVAEALGNLGVIYRYTGDFENSTEFLKRQLKIAEEQGDKIQISRTMGNLGWVLDGQQKYPEALEYYRNALTINRELGLKSEMIRMLDNIGYVLQCVGDYTQALEHHQDALAYAKEINDIESLINIRANMARACKLAGDFEEAYRHFELGLTLIEQSGMSHSLPEFLIEKADLLFEDGKKAEAAELAREGLTKAEELNNAEFTEKGKELLQKIESS